MVIPMGLMSTWSSFEILNYGKMSLYNAMLMCIIEPPRVITLDDIVLPDKRTRGGVKDWELHGILQCFLEL